MNVNSIVAFDADSQSVCDASQASDFLSAEGGLILYRISRQESCSGLHRPMLKAVHRGWAEVIYFRPSCGCWSCPGCAENLKKRWVLTATQGCKVFQQQGLAVDFVTVTSHERLSAGASRAVLSGAWDQLRRRVSRASASHEYFLVPEQHQNGRWHIHALITAHELPKRWWKDNARACGFGFQSDVKEVKSLGGAGAYVSKYLGKTLQNSNLPKHFRRVRLSAAWPRLPDLPKPDGWIFMPLDANTPLAWDVERYEKQGYQVVVADADSAWDWVNPSV